MFISLISSTSLLHILRRSASAHGPKLSVSDISSLLSMVGDGSSTESSPRSESVLITTTPLTLSSPLHPNYLSIQSSDTAEITRLTSRNSVSLYIALASFCLPLLPPPLSLSLSYSLNRHHQFQRPGRQTGTAGLLHTRQQES